MHANDIEKIAFSSPSGLFQFRRMPFVLVNVEASYGRMMRKLLNGLYGVDNYVDDVMVHTQTWPEHLAVVRGIPKNNPNN